MHDTRCVRYDIAPPLKRKAPATELTVKLARRTPESHDDHVIRCSYSLVCVCVCVRERVCVCVCVHTCLRSTYICIYIYIYIYILYRSVV